MELWMYLVLSGIIGIIWAIILPGKPSKTKQGASLDDLEESLNSFTAGMEEDNRELNRTIDMLKREHELQKSDLMKRIDYLEKRSQQIEDDTRRAVRSVEEEFLQKLRTGAAMVDSGQAADLVEAVQIEPATLVERYPELFELFSQGKSIEFIAKKLGLNKGEVILIIDLAKQGELI